MTTGFHNNILVAIHRMTASVQLLLFVAIGSLLAGSARSESLALQSFTPAAGARDVCPDSPLRIQFASTPVTGTGRIVICDAANDSAVDTIAVDSPTRVQTIGGLPNFKVYPVIITGHEAVIYPAKGALDYNKTYYIRLEPGVFKDAAGNTSAEMNGATGWRFTTKAAPPEAGIKTITVAVDGTGDFATVQGAIDFIPEKNTTPVTIHIRNGTYNEIVCLVEKDNVTLQGEDRRKTIIAYANNDRFNNNAGGNPFSTTAPAPAAANARRGGAVYRRGMFLAHHVNDLTITNLTLHNTTPQGGSQAEAIIVNGSPNAHTILRGVDLYSYQDTLQINGQAYLSDCYIEGDVDFMWGTGPCFFDRCYCRALRSNAYYTQIRNPPTNHGYVYKDCTFDGAKGITGNFLSRIDPSRFTASEVVLLNCTMTDAVGPVSWRLDKSPDPQNVHFWEYNSHGWDGKPVDVSKRSPISRQLKLPDDQQTIEQYSDPKFVLGGNGRRIEIELQRLRQEGAQRLRRGTGFHVRRPGKRVHFNS